MPDLVRLFLAITERPYGRTSLMNALKLGEATVKTMLKFLRERKLVEQGTRGVYPTKKGLEAFSFLSSFSNLQAIDIPDFSEAAVALVVKSSAGRVASGIEQRDEGVKLGAKIITLVKKDGRLMLAGVPQHEPPYKDAVEQLAYPSSQPRTNNPSGACRNSSACSEVRRDSSSCPASRHHSRSCCISEAGS